MLLYDCACFYLFNNGHGMLNATMEKWVVPMSNKDILNQTLDQWDMLRGDYVAS